MGTNASADNGDEPLHADGSAAFFRAVVDTAVNPYVLIDDSFVLRYASPSIEMLLGWKPEDWVGSSIIDLLSPHSLELATAGLDEIGLASRDPNWVGAPIRLFLLDAGGTEIPVDAYSRETARTGIEGTLVQLVRAGASQTMGDAIDTILGGHDLDHALGLLTSLTEHDITNSAAMLGSGWTGSGFTRVAGHDRLLFLTALDPIDRVAIDRLLSGPDDVVDLFEDLAPHTRAAATKRGWRACWCAKVPVREGEPVSAALFIWYREPGPPGVIYRDNIARSVSLARLALRWMGNQRSLAWGATHDHLTGLTNRAEFQNSLDATVGGPRAVLFCDLDDFKPVNEQLGHRAGDRVIATVAERLRKTCDGCVVARLGGDEFAVLVDAVSTLDALVGLAERVQQTLDDPIVTAAESAVVGMTIGIAFDPTGSTDSDHLMDRADQLLRRGKAEGKGRILSMTVT